MLHQVIRNKVDNTISKIIIGNTIDVYLLGFNVNLQNVLPLLLVKGFIHTYMQPS